MAIHAKYKIPVFWSDEFKSLTYVNETFNDKVSLKRWKELGYSNKVTGDMCDMRSPQPKCNTQFLKIFTEMGWKDIGTSYYKMTTGTVLPTHSDLYLRYIDLYNLQGQEHTIRRAVVFLEDWKPGHYSEINGDGMAFWTAGTTLEWHYDAPHAAANIGIEPRYTLQLTGHI